MNKIATILERYKTAAISERLHIFLEFRDLRDEFTDIEMYLYNSPYDQKQDKISCLKKACSKEKKLKPPWLRKELP
jgi:hypothetical protein